MAVLKNGVANKLSFTMKNEDNTPATGKTVAFCVVLQAYELPLGVEAIPDSQKIGGGDFSCVERSGGVGIYDGTLTLAASLLLDPLRRYRVIPFVVGQFRGGRPDENVFRVEYA